MIETADFWNLAGLSLITVGSICAANAAPTPTYGPDGSVSLVGPGLQDDKSKRIKMHNRQKRFPKFLWMIAFGAILQALAVLVPYL